LAKFEGPLYQRAFRFVESRRALRDARLPPTPNKRAAAPLPPVEKCAAIRSIVAKSALYTVGYHGYQDAAVQHTKCKNHLK
jgi:hypothetical protein